MIKHTEVMKLALEALQKIYIAPEHEDYIKNWWPACEQAITALREALASEAKEQPALSIGNIKPNYNMTFHRDVKQIGVLNFNGPEMTFTGDADESAKLFFDFIAKSFKERLEQERADEREQCAGLCDRFVNRMMSAEECAAAIRNRSNT